VAAYRDALEVFTREQTQYYWDETQKSLDAALKLLEERKRQTLKEPRDAG
jgi:predicted N-acyltransferase